MDQKKYLKYKKKYLELKQKNNLLQNGGSELDFFNEKNLNKKNPQFILFKANWCGHCQNFKDTWNALSNKFKNKINFIMYDSEINKNEIKQWGINSFPSLILKNGNQALEYNNNRDLDSLINFINNNTTLEIE